MAQSSICRLCIKASNDFKSLYQDNGWPSKLWDITWEYFHPKIVNMEVSKHLTTLCLECFCHIDEFHSFQMSVMKVQLNLSETPNVVPIKTEIEDNISEVDFSVENPTKVKQECLSLSDYDQSQDAAVVEFATKDDKQDFIIKPELEIIDVQGHNQNTPIEQTTEGYSFADKPGSSKTGINKSTFKTQISVSSASDSHSDAGDICLGNDTISSVYRSSKEDTTKKFNCKLCGKCYAGKRRLRVHLKKYHPGFCPSNLDPEYDATTNSFPCKLCGAQFAQKRSLTNHTQSRHANQIDGVQKDDNKLVKCGVCGLSYSCYKGLRKHWNKSHPDMYNSDYDPATNSYKCKICGNSFATKRNLATHMTKRHRQPNCLTTEESSSSVQQDIGHNEMDSQPNLQEEVCELSKEASKDNETYTGELRISPKLESVEQEETVEPNPQDCEGLVSQADDDNVPKHSSKKFNCNLCNSSYGSRTILLRHLKYHHPGVKPQMFCADNDYDAATNRFKCKHCGTLFLKKRYLACHMQHQHSGNAPERKVAQKMFTCNSCGLAYQRFDSLKRHIRSKHEQKQIWSLAGFDYDYDESTKTYNCKICGNTYGLKPNFIKHMQTMHPETRQNDNVSAEDDIDEQAFKCQLCERAFKLDATLKQHMKRRHGEKSDASAAFEFDYDDSTKMFKCKLCSRTFKSKGALKKHMESQHWEESEFSEKIEYDNMTRKFKCKLCNRSFEYKRILITHLIRQHGKRHSTKYECPKCRSSFLTKSGLTQHCNTVHCPARVYPCKECGQTFKQFKDLYFHRQKVHTVKNEPQSDTEV